MASQDLIEYAIQHAAKHPSPPLTKRQIIEREKAKIKEREKQVVQRLYFSLSPEKRKRFLAGESLEILSVEGNQTIYVR
jgi:hypothetical protein